MVNIEIPDSVESIGDYAFYGCLELRTVKISNASNLNEIDRYAFTMCEKLKEINIPSSVAKNTFSSDNCSLYSYSDDYYSDDSNSDDCQNSTNSVPPTANNYEYKGGISSNNPKKDKCSIY